MFVVASDGVTLDFTLGVKDIFVRPGDTANGLAVSSVFGTCEGVIDGEMVDNNDWAADETGDRLSF